MCAMNVWLMCPHTQYAFCTGCWKVGLGILNETDQKLRFGKIASWLRVQQEATSLLFQGLWWKQYTKDKVESLSNLHPTKERISLFSSLVFHQCYWHTQIPDGSVETGTPFIVQPLLSSKSVDSTACKGKTKWVFSSVAPESAFGNTHIFWSDPAEDTHTEECKTCVEINVFSLPGIWWLKLKVHLLLHPVACLCQPDAAEKPTSQKGAQYPILFLYLVSKLGSSGPSLAFRSPTSRTFAPG